MAILHLQLMPQACNHFLMRMQMEFHWVHNQFGDGIASLIPENLKIEEAQKVYELEGRKISYTVQPKEPERAKKAVEYFRVNPHRLQLGNIGLEIKKKDGSLATANDIRNINQQLDLWTGIITSSFTVENVPVKSDHSLSPNAGCCFI
jgi:hypothetical protein